MRHPATLAFAVVILAGCGADPDPPDAGRPVAELGTGAAAFEPLAPGALVRVHAGRQGGYHLIVHARIRGLAPGAPGTPGSSSNPNTAFRAFAPDGAGERPSAPPFRVGYERATDGWLALPSGRLLLLDPGEVPSLTAAGSGSRCRSPTPAGAPPGMPSTWSPRSMMRWRRFRAARRRRILLQWCRDRRGHRARR